MDYGSYKSAFVLTEVFDINLCIMVRTNDSTMSTNSASLPGKGNFNWKLEILAGCALF